MPLERREPLPPQQPTTSGRWQDALFERTTQAFALLVLLLLVAIIGSLVYGALPALEKFGPAFFVTNVWNPVTKQFGALAPIYGTLVTSGIALLIGMPVSFGIALFLTEMCPPLLKRPLGHRGGVAGGDPEHHLRHVGPVRVCADLRRLHPALSRQDARQYAL